MPLSGPTRAALLTRRSTLLDQLVAWYRGGLADAHAGHHLTNNNGVTFSAGKVGLACDFASASSQYASSASTDFALLGNFTIAGWFKLTSTPGNMNIVDRLAAGGGYALYWKNGSSAFSLYVANGGTTAEAVWGAALTTATWYHVAGWLDTVAQKVYLAVNHGTPVEAAFATTPANAGVNFSLGSYSAGSASFFNGSLDEVAIARRVWSTGERAEHYGGGAGISYPG